MHQRPWPFDDTRRFALAAVVGIDGLVQVPPLLPLLGVGMAVAVGTLGVVVAGRRVARLDPLVVLEGR